jgi:hypothetical protein
LNLLQAKLVGAVLEEIHRDIDFVTECREQVIRQCGARSQGKKETPVRTLGGKQTQIRTPRAWFPKKSDPKCKEKRRDQGEGSIYPVLRRLGIVRGTTPRLLAELSRQMTDGPSILEVKERLANREIVTSRRLIELRTYDLASISLWKRQNDLNDLNQTEAVEPAPLAGKRVVIGLDGGRLRIRTNKVKDDDTETKSSYTTNKCEPKILVIYTIDQKGNKERTGEVVYDATIQSSEYLFSILNLRLKQLGIKQAELLVITGDGSPWIWKGAAKLPTALDLEKTRVVEVIDFAHSAGKLRSRL